MIWEHFASVLRRDSKRAVPITKLSAESVYLNNFSKMRVNLAVHTLYPIVAQEMLEHENTATSSTQTYILKCSRLFQILNSEDPIKVIEDPRIKELEDINNWFKIWQNTVKTQYHSASESNKHQISWQTQQDLTITITSFIDLCKYIMDKKFQDIYPEKPYIIPRRLNQDIVES